MVRAAEYAGIGMSENRLTTTAGEHASPTRQLAVIWPLLGRHIAFHRRLVDLTSSVKAALLLSQTIYWTRHGRDLDHSAGWFMKTVAQWELETGLTEREQATARERLRRMALFAERRVGVPAKLHFCLDTDRLAALLSTRVGRACGSLDWSDGVAVAALLGPALAYHRSLARIARSVHAGLLLSRALHLTRLQAAQRLDGWATRSTSQWTDDLGLTRREQEGARHDLADIGVWEEVYAGFPPRLGARVRLDTVLALLAGLAPVSERALAGLGQFDCGDPAHQDAQNRGTSRWESHHLDPTKPPIQFRRIRHHSSDETAIPLIQRSTSVSVQPPHTREEVSTQCPQQRGGELIFPESLQPEERAAALLLIERCGDQAQALLDELTARMQANAIRTTPIAYLRGLVARASAGTFEPAAGLRITAARRRHQEDALERQQRDLEAQRLAAERASPEYLAKMATRRAEIRQWLDNAKRRRPGGERA